ncbi:EbsA family protein [Pontibacter virosus]|nr:EbsA family protein [Pontibacter virosus]
MERLLFVLALLSVALHGWLLYQLIAVRDFHSAMTFLYLFSLLPFSLFLISVWLDHNPGYQRHLTLSASGVRYRLGFMQREHDFEWEEVERIIISSQTLEFELKNDEQHAIALNSVNHAQTLQRIRDELAQIAEAKGIALETTQH